jgi:hypothetical protein
MNLHLTRFSYEIDGIFGMLFSGADWSLYTLEHAYPSLHEEKQFLPKIPAGIYQCVRGLHQLEGMTEPFTTFEITGVSGHTGLLFHSGNTDKDSSGCVILGNGIIGAVGYRAVINSKVSFAKFMSYLNGIDVFTLEVE